MYGHGSTAASAAAASAGVATLPDTGGLPLYLFVFLALVAVLCAAGALWRVLPRRER